MEKTFHEQRTDASLHSLHILVVQRMLSYFYITSDKNSKHKVLSLKLPTIMNLQQKVDLLRFLVKPSAN